MADARIALNVQRIVASLAGMQVFGPAVPVISPPRNQGTAVVFIPLGQAGSVLSRLGMPRSLTFNASSVFSGVT